MLLDSLTLTISSGVVAASSATSSKVPLERIKHNYEEDAFRQMTVQIGSWPNSSSPAPTREPTRAYHLELGKELLAHGFTTEAEAEFRHAAAIVEHCAKQDYDAREAQSSRPGEAALRIRESKAAPCNCSPAEAHAESAAATTMNPSRSFARRESIHLLALVWGRAPSPVKPSTRLLFWIRCALAALLAASCSADVLRIAVNDAIQPVTAEFIARARHRRR
jgi:hypothetical protein